MTNGGRGPEHGQNRLVSKTCSIMEKEGREGRERREGEKGGGAVAYSSSFQPAEGSRCL